MASATAYTGPSAREMFESHTLSKEIIARAKDPEPVLDESELALLKRYVTAPETKSEILRELGFTDEDRKILKGKEHGDGSLVAYIMIQSVHGNDLLLEKEIADLKAWFDKS
ncbi:hypothetical protein ONS95_013936 [Cadophora gregata]|uniref:uncharacterized protein n=1 Tax=Cadophora gregata TaxID=51156 RepID=UPI0026DB6B2F|nr:uncharacterized protein ONS95_013936 [Cadophora gregata]KAK0113688.1 hypothetical protein ONS96_014543 [Cadophora gregata f. sp. sojae]KAK0114446.1 hypothetical protein ONS95_013936 [Cadophora gregata]